MKLLAKATTSLTRFIQALDALMSHPAWGLGVGLFFIGTGLFDVFSKIAGDLDEIRLRTQPGVLVLGIGILIGSLAETLDSLGSGSEALEKANISRLQRFVRGFYLFMHRKSVLGVTAVFLLLAGFSDAAEFVMAADFDSTASALMLWIYGFGALAFLLLGATEATEHVRPGQFRERIETLLSPRIQLIAALLVLALSIWEGVEEANKPFVLSTDQAPLIWALGKTFKYATRSLSQITRVALKKV